MALRAQRYRILGARPEVMQLHCEKARRRRRCCSAATRRDDGPWQPRRGARKQRCFPSATNRERTRKAHRRRCHYLCYRLLVGRLPTPVGLWPELFRQGSGCSSSKPHRYSRCPDETFLLISGPRLPRSTSCSGTATGLSRSPQARWSSRWKTSPSSNGGSATPRGPRRKALPWRFGNRSSSSAFRSGRGSAKSPPTARSSGAASR